MGVGQHSGRTQQQDGKKTQDRRQGGSVGVGQHGGRTPAALLARRVQPKNRRPRSGFGVLIGVELRSEPQRQPQPLNCWVLQ